MPIEPLAVFRIVFSGIMLLSTIRFALNGWIYELYVLPKYYFTYYGFEWVRPIGEIGMYVVFICLGISFLFQLLGYFYRFASFFSFTAFTYIELIDKTNYLNHYYFVSLICFLLIFVPANRNYSLDIKYRKLKPYSDIPAWTLNIFKLQLVLVYLFAGIAKLNYDWMVEALPLKLWLPSKSNLPLIGFLFKFEWLAFLFSWFGAIYDLTIWYFLLKRNTRMWAYFFVIIFHLLTWILFPIGVFPYVMIGTTIIFFSTEFHNQFLKKLGFKTFYEPTRKDYKYPSYVKKPLLCLIVIYVLFQLIIPFRYLAYPDNLFWREEGYRFSWRVMLMEKAGYAIFKVNDKKTGKNWEVNNYDFLTPNQEKMMSTQPDMILQFAHYLNQHYLNKGLEDIEITVSSYVSLNGSISQLYIDPNVDLIKEKESFLPKSFILPKPNR